jgi:hypothetical protein
LSGRRLRWSLEHPGEFAGFVLFRLLSGRGLRILRFKHPGELANLFRRRRGRRLGSFRSLEHVGELTRHDRRGRFRRRRVRLGWNRRNVRLGRGRGAGRRFHFAAELGNGDSPVARLGKLVAGCRWSRYRTKPIRERHRPVPGSGDHVRGAFVFADFDNFLARRIRKISHTIQEGFMLAHRADQKMYSDCLTGLNLTRAERFNRAVIDDIEQLISLIETHGVPFLLPVFTKRTTFCKPQISNETAMVEYYRCRQLNWCNATRKDRRL